MKTDASLPTFENADLRHHGSGNAPIVAIGRTLSGAHMYGLLPCDDWNKADWRIPLAPKIDHAVIIKITGRKPVQWGRSAWLRCRIEWVGDGEPSQFSRGFVRVT